MIAESVKKVLMEGCHNSGCIVNEWENTKELASYLQSKTGCVMNVLNNMKAEIAGIQSQVPNMDDEKKDKLYQMLIKIHSDLFNITHPSQY